MEGGGAANGWRLRHRNRRKAPRAGEPYPLPRFGEIRFVSAIDSSTGMAGADLRFRRTGRLLLESLFIGGAFAASACRDEGLSSGSND